MRSLGEGEKEEEKKEEADASCYCSSANLEVLELSSRKKWLQIWNEVSDRILKLPWWMQQMILDDLNVAVQNRISVMERVQKRKAVLK